MSPDSQHYSTPMSQVSTWAAVIFAFVMPTLVTLLYFVWAADYPPAVQQTSYAIGKLIQFGFPLVWVCLICKQRPQFWPWSSRGLAIGICFGFVVAAFMFWLYHGWLKSSSMYAILEEAVSQKVSGIGLNLSAYIAVSVFYSLVHSLLEEYYFRWFLFGQLRTVCNFWPAAVISGLGFMAHHVFVLGKFLTFSSPLTWLFSLCIAFGGVAWAWLYERSGSLLGPWFSHLLVDAAIFAIGYEIVVKLQ